MSPKKPETSTIEIKQHKANKSVLPEISFDHSDFMPHNYMTPMNQKQSNPRLLSEDSSHVRVRIHGNRAFEKWEKYIQI